jgi:hypothetical protein
MKNAKATTTDLLLTIRQIGGRTGLSERTLYMVAKGRTASEGAVTSIMETLDLPDVASARQHLAHLVETARIVDETFSAEERSRSRKRLRASGSSDMNPSADTSIMGALLLTSVTG